MVPEAPQPGDAGPLLKPLSLLGVLMTARLLLLLLGVLPWSWWLPLALLWQDVLLVVLFAGLDWVLKRWPRAGWTLYAAVTGYTAINVAVASVLCTFLTWPMIRATSGPLRDSITHHATVPNLLRVTLVLAVAVAIPFLLRRWRPSPRLQLLGAALALGLLLSGPLASNRCETLGMHRNACFALVLTAWPRVTPLDSRADWGRPPLGSPSVDEFAHLRGKARGRHVVLIHLESTAARRLGLHGATDDPMPTLSRLARQGLVFDSAYSAYPETIRSFLAVHNGVHPALDVPARAYRTPPTRSLGQVLLVAGYRTGLFHSGRFAYLDMDSVLHDRGFDTCADASAIGGQHDSSFGIDEESTVRHILRWIDDTPAQRPFFVTYLPIAGHHPYATPEQVQNRLPFPRRMDEDRYRNALFYADLALTQLIEGLRVRGLLTSTLFVVCGDHGQAFGEHSGNIGHALFLYEENVRVPLLFAAPGLIEQPLRSSRVASLVDLTPTTLDLLGLPSSDGQDGRSLLLGRGRLALFCTDYSLAFVGLRDGRWKFIHELDSGRSHLFDLHADPDERHDLAAEHPERVAVYRAHLLGWSAARKHRLTRR